MASTTATPTTKLRPDYFSKREGELYDGMRSLPIRMKDRRELYADLEAIYDFTSQLQDVGKKRIPFFRLRLYFQILKYKLKELGMWEHSLREIEIQRGTLTANVFYFIRWTMLFNLALSIVAILGMYLPYAIFFILFRDAPKNMACDLSQWNETDPNRKVLNKEELADCCHAYLVYKEKNELGKNDTQGNIHQFLLHFSEIFGGHTSSFLTTPFFFGYYSSNVVETMGKQDSYRLALPVLYNLSVILIIIISFCVLVKAIGNGVAEIVRNKDGDVCIFSELVFCGFWHRAQDDNEARFRRKLWLHNLRVAINQAKATARAGKPSTALLTKRWACFAGCNLIIIIFAVLIYFLADYCYEEARNLRDRAPNPNDTEKDRIQRLARGIVWSLLPSIGIAIGNGALPTFFIRVGKMEGYALELSTVIVLCRSLAVRLISVGLAISRVITNDYACQNLEENTCTICPPDPDGSRQYRETCWESHLGRELYKIIFTELVIKCLLTFIVDPARKLTKKIMYGLKAMRAFGTLRFNVVRHSLDIINIQVMSWIGFYFAPAYPLAVVFYLVVIFYVKKFSVLVNCTGTPEAYRVSRTTTIFLLGELVSFVIVVIFLIVVLGYLEPSKGCGPFHAHKRTWQTFQVYGAIIDDSGQISGQKWWAHVIETMISPSVYIPLQIGSLAWLIHKYYATVANRDYYESLKDLIILENQDKQYLVNRLLKLRAEFYNINYFDPISIYDSEQKYVESTNRRLMKQWQALATVKKDSGLATSKWYEGLRRRDSSTGSRKFPSQGQLHDLVELHTEYEKKLKDRETEKPKAIPQTRSRKTIPRPTAAKRAKTPGTDEDKKPYSGPSMLYLMVNKHKGKKRHSKKKKTISVPPKSKKVAPAALKKKHVTDGSSVPTTSAPTSGTEPDPEVSESEAGLKRRKGKVERQAPRRHSKKGPRRRKRASSAKKGNKKRRVAPAAVNTTTTEDETSSATTSKGILKDGTTTDDDDFNYLWDNDKYGGA